MRGLSMGLPFARGVTGQCGQDRVTRNSAIPPDQAELGGTANSQTAMVFSIGFLRATPTDQTEESLPTGGVRVREGCNRGGEGWEMEGASGERVGDGWDRVGAGRERVETGLGGGWARVGHELGVGWDNIPPFPLGMYGGSTLPKRPCGGGRQLRAWRRWKFSHGV